CLSPGGKPPPGSLAVGLPAPEMDVQVCDELGQPASPGETGELVVRSRYLSLGYWRNPELTATTFSTDPARPEIRIYRGGDRARWTDTGELMVLGRHDDQVKVRGYRIELGPLEAAVSAVNGVFSCAVVAFENADSLVRLAAFVVSRPGSRLDGILLRQTLRETLPSYMVPGTLVFLPAFPLTAHGKVDKAALREMATAHPATGMGGAPATETEELLAGIWQDVFGIDALGRDDDFFNLGGDSLLAAVIAAKIHHFLRIQIDLHDFISHPILAQMSARVDLIASGTVERADVPPLIPLQLGNAGPLSFVEERTWNICQLNPSSVGYNVAVTHRLQGNLDLEAFTHALTKIIEKHELLRTNYIATPAGPIRLIHQQLDLDMDYYDASTEIDPLAATKAVVHAMSQEPFDLESDRLLRFALVKTAPEEHLFLRVNHHIISDGWSWKLFFEDLAQVYSSVRNGLPAELAPLTLQYADFAAWQRSIMAIDGQIYVEQLNWWREQLQGSPHPVALPFRRETPLTDLSVENGVLPWG
ncbi:MAG TPA: condensation domain-containing protein, partial [Verrucomicrobium sp.]|nr:condensation domain-containing protein [Verrucomicrobium sp.]